VPKDDNVIDMLASSCRIRASSVTLRANALARTLRQTMIRSDLPSRFAERSPDAFLNSKVHQRLG
jgi:hypothetical protein